MILVRLSAGEWRTDALVAHSFLDRLLGTFRAPARLPVVMRARSIHTIGQSRPLSIVGLDREMRVISVRSVPPNRMVYLPSARTIVEVPEGAPLPAMDSQVGVDLV